MEDILVDILRQFLCAHRAGTVRPAAESLKGMVAIKGRMTADEFGDVSDCKGEQRGAGGGGGCGGVGATPAPGVSSDVASPPRVVGGGGHGPNGGGSGGGNNNNTASSSSSKNGKIAPQLARITLLHGTRIKRWDESIDNPAHHMHSFSESQVSRI